MKLSQFFIDRPIFAVVLSLLIVVGGGLALFRLPVSEYPSALESGSGQLWRPPMRHGCHGPEADDAGFDSFVRFAKPA